MFVKRLVLALISVGLGVLISLGIVKFVLDTIVSHYGNMYFLFTVLFLALAIGVWLDKFMDTKILPE